MNDLVDLNTVVDIKLMWGWPRIEFRTCYFYGILHDEWKGDVLEVVGDVWPNYPVVIAKFHRSEGPRWAWNAFSLELDKRFEFRNLYGDTFVSNRIMPY